MKPAPPVPEGSRYAHLTWDEVTPLVSAVWTDPLAIRRQLVSALQAVLSDLGTPWSTWRAARLQAAVTIEPAAPFDPIAEAGDLARLTVEDRQQRALDFTPASLEDLQRLRLDVQHAIQATGDPTMSHVRPWLWRWESLGQPLTTAGREAGYELRLSWYNKPITCA